MTYHIITIGCQMNKADSERVDAYLAMLGWKKTENQDKADWVIITTCGVRQSAEDRIYGLVPKIKKHHPKTKVILTGCLINRPDVRARLEKYVDIWLPIIELPTLAEKLGYPQPKFGSLDYLNLTSNHQSTFSAFVPIGNGCDNFCSYCVVPFARGRETYRSSKEIIKEVKDLLKKDYNEITLIAQNVNSYHDDKIDFPDLMAMVAKLPGDFWLKFATSHPKDLSDKLIKVIAANKKICPQIHLPVQSGDDDILRAMNRHYTSAHYLKLVAKIYKTIPDVSLGTDIIVGFPGETKKQFNNTAKLMRQAKFDQAFIACYSPRFGTASYKMEDKISAEEKRARERYLNDILKKTALVNSKKFLNQIVRVLVEGKKNNNYFGKNSIGKKVIFSANKNLIGQFVEIKINKAKDFGLYGELVK